MASKTQKEMIQEIHQGMFGVPDTADTGLVGQVKKINSRVSRNSKLIFLIIGAISASGISFGVVSIIGG